ncbi:hypothetical protein BWQ96_00352 [Gracilariopsis chorda]|uniref:Uncharacterized protein n=1 Tax=Gracilariopsis chorda TaxID=448386 RepID=A0A2V3JAJ3_9FLOR|nr:hypothetical protein BWQ96_00352 [Gracilariopsis chorda]|eukprot:PXF49700.1 hypothetical protein BWQ96_00352 [Gracilariopsis chorda]
MDPTYSSTDQGTETSRLVRGLPWVWSYRVPGVQLEPRPAPEELAIRAMEGGRPTGVMSDTSGERVVHWRVRAPLYTVTPIAAVTGGQGDGARDRRRDRWTRSRMNPLGQLMPRAARSTAFDQWDIARRLERPRPLYELH